MRDVTVGRNDSADKHQLSNPNKHTHIIVSFTEQIAVDDADVLCVFPFTFDGEQYDDCIENIGATSNSSWCSLTSDYDVDHYSGNCIKGSPCVYL